MQSTIDKELERFELETILLEPYKYNQGPKKADLIKHLFDADRNEASKLGGGHLELQGPNGKIKLFVDSTTFKDNVINFWGWTGLVYYGSGAYGNGKEGFGLTYCKGYFNFDYKTGQCRSLLIQKMKDGIFHR